MPKIKTKCHVCGKEIFRWPYSLKASNGISYCSSKCKGIAQLGIKPPNKANLLGQRFGHLTVIAEHGSKNGHTVWKCCCDCGRVNYVSTGCLKSGIIQSCGCLQTRRGKNHPNWRKGFHITEAGYREIPIPDSQAKHRYYAEHRCVMEKYLGRTLGPEEVVHHINGNKLDNRIENLAVLSREEHAAIHAGVRFRGR